MRSSWFSWALILACGAAACSSAGSTDIGPSGAAGGGGDAVGGSGGGGGAPVGLALRIEPADLVLAPSEGEQSVEYKAWLLDGDKGEVDVSAEATFSLDNAGLGIFVGPRLTIPPNARGKAQVKVLARGVTATTSLFLVEKSVVIGPGAGPDAPGKFGNEVDPKASLQVVYPPSGVLVPPNMNSLEFHFIPAPGQTLFELRLLAPKVQLSAYFGCTPVGGGCIYTPDPTFWGTLALQARGAGPVSYTLRGVDGAAPGPVGQSPEGTIEFAGDPIVGGIYYWNSAGSIQRYDFGFPGKQSELYMNAPGAGALTCVGCHVLSRDGKKIAVGLDIPAPAPFKVFDVATKTLAFAQGTTFGGGANFFSFSPDASQILTSNGISISLRDATTGAALIDPIVPSGTMPDWSADGNKVVYARAASAPPLGFGVPGVSSAALDLLSYDGQAWQTSTLVPFTGANNYYPSFSPDNNWVVYNVSPSNRDSFSNATKDDNGNLPDGQVWAVSSKGGTPIRLAKASPTGGDQWAKWVPDIASYAGGTVMWLTFSSARSYGLRLGEGQQVQLWMTGFDPARAAKGEDPSFPAFWLPFQDPGSGNHIAQWVTKVVRKPCAQNNECENGELCTENYCVPDIK